MLTNQAILHLLADNGNRATRFYAQCRLHEGDSVGLLLLQPADWVGAYKTLQDALFFFDWDQAQLRKVLAKVVSAKVKPDWRNLEELLNYGGKEVAEAYKNSGDSYLQGLADWWASAHHHKWYESSSPRW